jgi:hypothetical protein
VQVAAPLSREEFLSLYQGDRRYTTYQEAVRSLGVLPVSARDARIDVFVKAEKIGTHMPGGKCDPAPRVIQPRSARYNVEVGRFLKDLEHRIYSSIAELCGGPTVMKGYNAAQVAKHIRGMWGTFTRPVAVGLDASRFDQHVSKQALRWEHDVYTRCFRGCDRKELHRLLQWQLVNSGHSRTKDGYVKYQVQGCRMSGDMNTALGNCLIMCGLVDAWCKSARVKYRLANNGDDCVVIMESKDLRRFSEGLGEWFGTMGFTMKVEQPVYCFEEIEFCQARPVCVDNTWVMVRNPHVVAVKDLCSVLPCEQERIRLGYLTTLGKCGMALSSGVPMLQELYATMVRSGRGVNIGLHPGLESGARMLARGMVGRYVDVSIDTRVSFWKAFGIMPCDQVAFERRVAGVDFGSPGVADREITADPTAPPQFPVCAIREYETKQR